MEISDVRDYCLKKNGVTEGTPFGPDVVVFKVGGKIFLLLPLDADRTINIKCDPENAIELREEFPDDVFPGYHMNKKHWNTVKINGSVSSRLLKEWIDHSYHLVVDSLSAKEKISFSKSAK